MVRDGLTLGYCIEGGPFWLALSIRPKGPRVFGTTLPRGSTSQPVSKKHGVGRKRPSKASASVFNRKNLTWEMVVMQDLTAKGDGQPE